MTETCKQVLSDSIHTSSDSGHDRKSEIPNTTMIINTQRQLLAYFVILISLVWGLQYGRKESRLAISTALSEKIHANTTQQQQSNDATANTSRHKRFGFYFIGDTPYTVQQEKILEEQVDDMKRKSNATSTNLEFIVHVGDIQKVTRTKCDPPYYEFVASMLRKAHLPMIVIPGDNDWYDCEDKQGRFDLFQGIYSKFHQQWKGTYQQALPSIVHEPNHPELFEFQKEGVLFVSINLVNMPEDDPFYQPMMDKNIAWIDATFGKYFKDESLTIPRGVIIIGHSLRSPETRPIFEHMAAHMNTTEELRNLPFVYLYGDGHSWIVNIKLQKQLNWPHMTAVQCDQLGVSDPVIVEIASTNSDGKLIPLKQKHDNQLVLGDGLIRLDRQRGDWRAKPKKVASKE